MDEQVRQFKEARQRASEAAFDFMQANPNMAGVIVVRDGIAVRRDQSGNEALIPYQEATHVQTHVQPV